MPGAPPAEAVSEPWESPSLEEEEEEEEERLPEEEELLLDELLELEGMDGIEAVDEEDELDGSDGARDEDDDEDELGIEGEDEGEPDDEELGIEGMPPLLELCWVDSQPARTRASAEAPTRLMVRPETRRRNEVFMVASLTFEGARDR